MSFTENKASGINLSFIGIGINLSEVFSSPGKLVFCGGCFE